MVTMLQQRSPQGCHEPVCLPDHVEQQWPRALWPPDNPVLLQLQKFCIRCRQFLLAQNLEVGGDGRSRGLYVLLHIVSTAGKTLEGQTKSSNSTRNSRNHSSESSSGAGRLDAPLVGAPPPRSWLQTPGDEDDVSVLASQDAIADKEDAKRVTNDCSNAISTRQLDARSWVGWWLPKGLTASNGLICWYLVRICCRRRSSPDGNRALHRLDARDGIEAQLDDLLAEGSNSMIEPVPFLHEKPSPWSRTPRERTTWRRYLVEGWCSLGCSLQPL